MLPHELHVEAFAAPTIHLERCFFNAMLASFACSARIEDGNLDKFWASPDSQLILDFLASKPTVCKTEVHSWNLCADCNLSAPHPSGLDEVPSSGGPDLFSPPKSLTFSSFSLPLHPRLPLVLTLNVSYPHTCPVVSFPYPDTPIQAPWTGFPCRGPELRCLNVPPLPRPNNRAAWRF